MPSAGFPRHKSEITAITRVFPRSVVSDRLRARWLSGAGRTGDGQQRLGAVTVCCNTPSIPKWSIGQRGVVSASVSLQYTGSA